MDMLGHTKQNINYCSSRQHRSRTVAVRAIATPVHAASILERLRRSMALEAPVTQTPGLGSPLPHLGDCVYLGEFLFFSCMCH